jgi:hypothetical protein
VSVNVHETISIVIADAGMKYLSTDLWEAD